MQLTLRSLLYYWRTNLAAVLGVAMGAGALAGALLVGASVRASLRDLVMARLGKTEGVISAMTPFREQLGSEADACPLLSMTGVITHQSSGRRAGQVQVYGVDDRFWKFHGVQVDTLADRDMLLSPALAAELAPKSGDAILLRIEKLSAIPGESLFAHKEDNGKTLRFASRGGLDAAHMGELSLRPQQGAVRAVFVPLRRLQKELEQQGKVNTLLLASADQKVAESERPDDLGLKARIIEDQKCFSIESGAGVLSDPLAAAIESSASQRKARTVPVLTYLANTIRGNGREIPYSLVTATELKNLGVDAGGDAIVLNEWAARDLGVKRGDKIGLDYYLWNSGGALTNASANFTLAAIVPVWGAAADRNLVPEYPGITGNESMHEWDPPFPIDLNRVRPRDEDYWKQYRTTPKAFLPIRRGQELWGSRFGKLSSIRVYPDGDLSAACDLFWKDLGSQIDAAHLGLAVAPVKAQNLEAAGGSTDFGEYFAYFSFFLVAAALMLGALFFRLGIEQRRREIGLLKALGFDARRLRVLFLTEGLAVCLAGGALGACASAAYNGVIVHGLNTWWNGAVGTTLLKPHLDAASILVGVTGAVLAAVLSILWTLRGMGKLQARGLLAGMVTEAQGSGKGRVVKVVGGGATLASAALLAWGATDSGSKTGAFFGAGALLMAAMLCAAFLLLTRREMTLASVSALGFRNSSHRPGRAVLCIALIAFATFVIVAIGAFRRDVGQDDFRRASGNGGYRLVAESQLPLYYDANTIPGREALNLPADIGVRFTSFRLKPGDDASCLNLYEPRNPRVIGAPEAFLREGHFTFASSMARSESEKQNPWLLLLNPAPDQPVPALADANSLEYVLHRKVGEELVLQSGSGNPIRLRFVGALRDSMLQSEIVISDAAFVRSFPRQQGFRFFLIDAPEQKAREAIGPMEHALSDYGFDAMPASDRIAGFDRVENTYLATFEALGRLGLVLGTLGLAAVLLRNALERRRELALLRAVGYAHAHLYRMILAENAFLLMTGLVVGTLCALIAAGPALLARGSTAPWLSLAGTLAAVMITGLTASALAAYVALQAPLLPALKAE